MAQQSVDFCQQMADDISRLVRRNRAKVEEHTALREQYEEDLKHWQNRTGPFAKYKDHDKDQRFQGHCWKRQGYCDNALIINGDINYGPYCAGWAQEKGLYAGEEYTMSWDSHEDCWDKCHIKRMCVRPDSSIKKAQEQYRLMEPKPPAKLEQEPVPVFNCCQQNIRFNQVGGNVVAKNIELMNKCLIDMKKTVVNNTPAVPTDNKDQTKADDGELVEREPKNKDGGENGNEDSSFVFFGGFISSSLSSLSLVIIIFLFVFVSA